MCPIRAAGGDSGQERTPSAWEETWSRSRLQGVKGHLTFDLQIQVRRKNMERCSESQGEQQSAHKEDADINKEFKGDAQVDQGNQVDQGDQVDQGAQRLRPPASLLTLS